MFIVNFTDNKTGNHFSYHSYSPTKEEAMDYCKKWIATNNLNLFSRDCRIDGVQEIQENK